MRDKNNRPPLIVFAVLVQEHPFVRRKSSGNSNGWAVRHGPDRSELNDPRFYKITVKNQLELELQKACCGWAVLREC